MKANFSFCRYKLRLLFAAVAVVAIALAVVVEATSELNSISRGRQQLNSVINAPHPAMARQGVRENGHSSIAASPKSGGLAIVTFTPVPRWLVPFAMLADHGTYPPVTEIQLVAPGFDDSQLKALAAIDTLKSFDFDQTQVTDAGLSDFCKKSNVEHIQVGNHNTNITESGRRLAARINSEHDYVPKWPPTS